LNDKEWAKTIYEKASETCESSSDFCDLAISIGEAEYLGDKVWARQLFEKSEQLAGDSSDYLNLANSVIDKNVLNDFSWARTLYEKSEQSINEDPDELVALGQAVVSDSSLMDHAWANKLFEKAEPLISDFYSLMYLGDSIFTDLDNEDWARRVYEKAEQAADDDDDRNNLSESIKDNLKDSEWADRLKNEDCSSEEGSSTEKYEIYIKSEPAGEYYFDKLSAEDVASLKGAFGDNEKLESLDFWVSSEEQNALGCAWGVSLVDFTIPEDEDCDIVGYIDKTDGDFNIDYSNNGIYIFCSKPTKLSTQFTLNVSECDFVPSELEVKYKNIIMSELSDSYGEINIQVIIGISYDGVDYTEEMQDSFVDRGYSLQKTIFQIHDNKFYPIIKLDDAGDIEWFENIKSECFPDLPGNNAVITEEVSPAPDETVCHSCGALSRAGAKFCLECGNKLAFECAKCGAGYTQGAKFCGECGASLIAKEGSPKEDESIVADKFTDLTTDSFPQSLGAHKRIYLQPEIPLKKFKKAHSSYLGDCELEDVLLFIDNTFMGSGKDGLAITGTRILEKEIIEDGTYLDLKDIEKIEAHKLKVFINDEEFTDLQMLDKDAVADLCNSLRVALNL